jgi:hypothetical protein
MKPTLGCRIAFFKWLGGFMTDLQNDVIRNFFFISAGFLACVCIVEFFLERFDQWMRDRSQR